MNWFDKFTIVIEYFAALATVIIACNQLSMWEMTEDVLGSLFEFLVICCVGIMGINFIPKPKNKEKEEE